MNGKKKRSHFSKRLGLTLGALALWYYATGSPERFTSENYLSQRQIQGADEYKNNQKTNNRLPEFIQTDRYKLIKDDDWLPSRAIGWAVSSVGKLLYWNYNYGKGLDRQRTKRVLETLENDKSISGITIRINHNEVMRHTRCGV
ncbi:MAG: hypothetical protein QMD85_03820 [Candidatus Aenigmarchaeota archaeon]|nr:hypothetical protein [Candidatus Aenigmarchaeota archaeon]MDI6722684.1 hypothetical protein [Candidatus Aenigmarchaeota archaeon]